MSTREDFEAWAASRGHNLNTIDGEYLYSAVRNAFDGYQAATSRQEAKIKALVESIKHIKANCDNCVTVYDECDKALAAAKATP